MRAVSCGAVRDLPVEGSKKKGAPVEEPGGDNTGNWARGGCVERSHPTQDVWSL